MFRLGLIQFEVGCLGFRVWGPSCFLEKVVPLNRVPLHRMKKRWATYDLKTFAVQELPANDSKNQKHPTNFPMLLPPPCMPQDVLLERCHGRLVHPSSGANSGCPFFFGRGGGGGGWGALLK